MAQAASFFYYNPESGSDSRQHDMFTPQPSAILKSSPASAQDGSMPLYMPTLARAVHKSSILSLEPHVLSVDTEFPLYDELTYPQTPGLSTTSSAVSSPPHSNYLPTPTNSFFFESLAGVKEGCEQEVKSEMVASFDFSRANSPPLTPVFVNPPNVTASQVSELLSTSSCPSLSPSPSPAPQQCIISQQAESFCDPRNLLVSSKSTPLINQLDIPTLPTFIPSNDDLILGAAPAKPATFEPLPPVVDSVPFFDNLDDLDSDTDFIADLSQESVSLCAGVKRPRIDSIPFSEGLSDCSLEDDWTTMTPISEASELSITPATKKQRMDESDDLDFAATYATGSETAAPSVSGSSGQEKQETSIAPAGDGDANASNSQQINRRGRKQSLTDDPSKTFVCTLCSRRFRRQEHLKRHYRSLHTQDKPFECTDCGKKFSRSDNLAQHARTHGNTTTIVGLSMPDIDERTASMSNHLFEMANAISSSSSSSGSEDEQSRKRKRDE